MHKYLIHLPIQNEMKWYNNVFWLSKYKYTYPLSIKICHNYGLFWILKMHNSIQRTVVCNSSCFMHFPLTNTIAVTITLYLFTDWLNLQIKPVSNRVSKPQKNIVQNVGRAGGKRKFSILTIRGTFTSHLDGQKVSIWASVFPYCLVAINLAKVFLLQKCKLSPHK